MSLEKNMVSIFGERGQQWLDSLPSITHALSTHWHLSHIQPVKKMTYHYVAKAYQDKTPVVLKISLNRSIEKEHQALQHFDGASIAQCLAYHAEHRALLLEQIQPGNSLFTIYPNNPQKTIEHYAKIIQHLSAQPQTNPSTFASTTQWLETIDKMPKEALPPTIIERALIIKKHLLSTPEPTFILHGDLHNDNVLSHHDRWVAIDPKGVVGELGFEAAWFDFICKSELNHPQVALLFEARVQQLAHYLSIDPVRLKDWIYLRLVLAACWCIQDKTSPKIFIDLLVTLFRRP